MKKGIEYLWTLWAVITIVAVLHLIRAVLGWSLVVENFIIPVWFSYIVFVIIGFLSYKLFTYLKK
jgi:hypothetical protein|tara:strand:- start:576 stop:770 length:195 start_codon:yes stop_codon:yes gene_type:complete